MSTQSSLNLKSKESGPVECLGQAFVSDEARRDHYLKLLAEKLKDPEFRKIEGFPIGEDEDILALSDPPYYTACPNPWIGDFIRNYGRPYDTKEKYHREPFAADVSEGKNHPIYNAHSYHTKVPHRAIMRYLLHYTEPGDMVFDGFCGTGMTGVAAQLCGDRREVQELGYRVDGNGVIFDESGKEISKLGSRTSVLGDLAPIATLLTEAYNNPVNVEEFEAEAKRILRTVESDLGWMYSTNHDGKGTGRINYVVWSDVFLCAHCGSEVVYWNAAVDQKNGRVLDSFPCGHCNSENSKRQMERAFETRFDKVLGEVVTQAKQVPVLINYSVGKKRYEKAPDENDRAVLRAIDDKEVPASVPVVRMPEGAETRRNDPAGLTHVHHFFTKRALIVFAELYSRAESSLMKAALLGGYTVGLKTARFLPLRWINKDTGPMKPHTAGTLYVPSLNGEQNWFNIFVARISASKRGQLPTELRRPIIETASASRNFDGANSLDYAFIDPPFGANLFYSELSFIVESWLRITTNNSSEAIENKAQSKTRDHYKELMTSAFRSVFRRLKPGRWMTVEFSNTQAAVWNTIQTAITEAGFVIANVAALDKKQGSFKAVTTTTAVKQDLVISAYKPNGGLEERFRKSGHTPEGVWDFLRTHLRNLPVVKARGGELEFVAERDPRILHDRMVAFYIGHGVPVPLSSAEFQAELAEKFPEREGMFFLSEQVAEWDKKRAQMQGVGQMSIFVEDEKSAIDWLRNFLKSRPSTYQDIQPEFMQQLGASWKKFETRPELNLLLEQNFIKYEGKGEVPSQIHSYLSTQNKDLRNLPKDDARLQNRAKDRWYVPDPSKAMDVEKLRNKRLLQEFWDLCDQAGIARPKPGDANQPTLPISTPVAIKKAGRKKLKEVRSEAVRLGFKECFAAKDYATILAIAHHLPDNVIEEDEQLQMMHDMAVMRTEA